MIGRGGAREHADIAALLPWYVNDTLGTDERERVEAHVAACQSCRQILAEERCVHEAMSREEAIEYIPAASLNRLRARLDDTDTAAAQDMPVAAARGRWVSWQGVMAASVTLMAVALGFVASDRWHQVRSSSTAPDYYTVTSPAPRAAGEVIRAVFAPTVTLAELQGILDEAHLRIVAGPTEAGVYSLARSDARGSASASLTLLRTHAKVRFAESTQPDSTPARSAGDAR